MREVPSWSSTAQQPILQDTCFQPCGQIRVLPLRGRWSSKQDLHEGHLWQDRRAVERADLGQFLEAKGWVFGIISKRRWSSKYRGLYELITWHRTQKCSMALSNDHVWQSMFNPRINYKFRTCFFLLCLTCCLEFGDGVNINISQRCKLNTCFEWSWTFLLKYVMFV